MARVCVCVRKMKNALERICNSYSARLRGVEGGGGGGGLTHSNAPGDNKMLAPDMQRSIALASQPVHETFSPSLSMKCAFYPNCVESGK